MMLRAAVDRGEQMSEICDFQIVAAGFIVYNLDYAFAAVYSVDYSAEIYRFFSLYLYIVGVFALGVDKCKWNALFFKLKKLLHLY